MSDDLLRVYFDPDEIGTDGYPYAWHGKYPGARLPNGGRYEPFMPSGDGPVKDLIRQQAGNRCERCGHPYEKGMGEWSPCDQHCTHGEPTRDIDGYDSDGIEHSMTQAQWRILTVHHLNGVKHDLRWWNLAALCQRCHLTIQAKVHLDRPYDRPHTEWFKPHAAGYYMSEEESEPSREWVLENMDEILMLHATQGTLL